MKQLLIDKYEIIYKDNISLIYKDIVDLYWQIENDQFVHNVKSIASKHQLKASKVYYIAKNYGAFKVDEVCYRCNDNYVVSTTKRNELFLLVGINCCTACMNILKQELPSSDDYYVTIYWDTTNS